MYIYSTLHRKTFLYEGQRKVNKLSAMHKCLGKTASSYLVLLPQLIVYMTQ